MENIAAAAVVTYKMTPRSRNLTRKALPAGWTVADYRKYAMGMSESRPSVEITLWIGERIEVIFLNCRIVSC